MQTERGRAILAAAERAEQELSEIQPDDPERRRTYSKVRISVSQHVLAGLAGPISQFIESHPEVLLDFMVSDSFSELQKYEADVILRIGRNRPNALHCKDLGPVPFRQYCRADEKGDVTKRWSGPTEKSKNQLQAPLAAIVNGVLPVRDLIVTAGMLPCFLGDADPRLKSCSDIYPNGKFRLYIARLREQRNLQRIVLVMRHLSRHISVALSVYETQENRR